MNSNLLAICAALSLIGCRTRPFNDSNTQEARTVPADQRGVYLQKAKVWIEGSDALVSQRNMLRGPENSSITAPDMPLECQFLEPDSENPSGGRTPKFKCNFGGDLEETKVKYDPYYNSIPGLAPGKHNMEVYGEVLATRIFWALGFGGDTIYTARVTCKNCPPDPWLQLRTKTVTPATGKPLLDMKDRFIGFVRTELLDSNGMCTGRCDERSDRVFFPAVIEKKFDGKEIVTEGKEGWDWSELYEDLGKVPASEITRRDALSILAAFISHMDNKDAQQRLVCVDKDWKKRRKENPLAQCHESFMLIQDAGSNFGNGWAPFQGEFRLNKLDLNKWQRLSIWGHPTDCVVTVHGAPNASFGNPFNQTLVVSESGRAFLANLMSKLTPNQIVDLFTAAHMEMAWSGEGNAIQEWAAVFQSKMKEQILDKRCNDVRRGR